MATDPLTRLLTGTFPNPDDGGNMAVPKTRIRIRDSLAGEELACLDGLELGYRLGVVSDPDTHAAFSAHLPSALGESYAIERIDLERHPHADLETAEAIARSASTCDALVAVGAGTINDLVKHAGAALGKPYVVFGTAPSMNGYVSANAAITAHGHKKSVPCQVPAGAFFDLSVLARAPVRMIRAGIGDSLCRSTAQVDWLLAHYLHDDAYQQAPFALLRDDEGALIENAGALVNGDRNAMMHLIRTLILSGFGMTHCGSSRPASQGEHLISHYIDMMAPPERPAYLHGEQIALATLTMAGLQESMLACPAPVVLPTTSTRAGVLAHFGETTGEECWHEVEAKRTDDAGLKALNRRIAERWETFRAAAEEVRRPYETLRSALAAASCPATPADIGCSAIFYRDAVRHARELRDRYTFLDLASDTPALSYALPRDDR